MKYEACPRNARMGGRDEVIRRSVNDEGWDEEGDEVCASCFLLHFVPHLIAVLVGYASSTRLVGVLRG